MADPFRSAGASGSRAAPRAIVIIVDSLGIGELPDAALYGDEGSNTLGHIASAIPLEVPALVSMGLGCLAPLGEGKPTTPARGAYGRMAEASPGKDSVTGHWELMGLPADRPFPVFPAGFPPSVMAEFERRIGRKTIGNIPASGTEIIERLGEEHLATGAPIVYTSADSVFQIAAHEEVVPVEELYGFCRAAYEIVVEGLGVGRVIARPFVGSPGTFRRTARRRDFAIPPHGDTVLDLVQRAGLPVVAIGKIEDLFAGRGITAAFHTSSDEEGMERVSAALEDVREGLVIANLVDFDSKYGHRNDVAGYAKNLERFDAWLAAFLERLGPDDTLFVTADHGNDPTTPSTDHSREYVPVLVAGPTVRPNVDIGVRQTFADLGQTLASLLGLPPLPGGTSFLDEILRV